MTEQKAYLLYEGDMWLSRASLNLCALFTTTDALSQYTQDMVARGVIDEQGHDFLNNGFRQTRGIGEWKDIAFMVEERSLNPTKFNG